MISCKIDKKPNLPKLRENKQLSQAEQRVLDYLQTLGYGVTQQVLFPITALSGKPTNVFVDAVVTGGVKQKEVVVEIDGVIWHSSMEAKQKDNHRDMELNKLGYPVVRLPYDKPNFSTNSITNQIWWNAYLFYCGEIVQEKFK